MNPEDCLNHQLNSSSSKFSYKFGKSERFPAKKLPTHTIYNMPDNHNRKTCCFGFGNRSTFPSKSVSPSPQNYYIPSSINLGKGKSFGTGRNKVNFGSFLSKSLKDKNVPGPNHYDLNSTLNKKFVTLKKRLPTDIDMRSKNQIPSPDRYNLQNILINKNGKYPYSCFRNCTNVFLGARPTAERKTEDGGPGSYNISASYDTNNFRKTKNGFGVSRRKGPEDQGKKNNPGPGQYELFSQFSSIPK